MAADGAAEHLLAFVGGVTGSVASLLLTIAPNPPERAQPIALAFTNLCAAAAAWAHCRRFMVPITVATGAIGVVGMTAGLVIAALPSVGQIL